MDSAPPKASLRLGIFWKYVDPNVGRLFWLLLVPFGWFLQGLSHFVKKTYFYNHLKAVVGEPIYGAAIALVGFLAATIGSLNSSEIKSAFPFCCVAGFNGYPVSPSHWTWVKEPSVYVFWGLAFSWLYLFMVQQDVSSTSINAIQAAANNIRDAVLHFPPRNFIRDFSRHVTNIRTRLLAGQQTSERAKLEETIRVLLGAVVSLAYGYDPRRARYAANVMIFIPRERDMPPYFEKIKEESIRHFLPEHYDLKYLQGLLLLPPTLSAVVQAHGDEVQDNIEREVIFGIPQDFMKGDRWTVLPGAPVAFVKWNLDREKDTANIRDASHGLDDIRQLRAIVYKTEAPEYYIDPSVIDEIEKYYRDSDEGQRVRSFQSYPLVDVDKSRKAFGILNVHCDQPVLLGGPPQEAYLRQETFAGVISPLVFDIAAVVKRWLEVTKGEFC